MKNTTEMQGVWWREVFGSAPEKSSCVINKLQDTVACLMTSAVNSTVYVF